MPKSITIPREEHERLIADKQRLDFLDASHRALNISAGNAKYGWKFVSSHNVRRLMAGSLGSLGYVDLNDAEATTPKDGGCSSVRVAIDRAIHYMSPENVVKNDNMIGLELLKFSREWQIEGDLIRCLECGRSIAFSRRDKPLKHSSCCKTHYAYPWAVLQNLLSVPTNSFQDTPKPKPTLGDIPAPTVRQDSSISI